MRGSETFFRPATVVAKTLEKAIEKALDLIAGTVEAEGRQFEVEENGFHPGREGGASGKSCA